MKLIYTHIPRQETWLTGLMASSRYRYRSVLLPNRSGLLLYAVIILWNTFQSYLLWRMVALFIGLYSWCRRAEAPKLHCRKSRWLSAMPHRPFQSLGFRDPKFFFVQLPCAHCYLENILTKARIWAFCPGRLTSDPLHGMQFCIVHSSKSLVLLHSQSATSRQFNQWSLTSPRSSFMGHSFKQVSWQSRGKNIELMIILTF